MDQDGICDELEILGCTDDYACNYDPIATEEDFGCEYEAILDANTNMHVITILQQQLQITNHVNTELVPVVQTLMLVTTILLYQKMMGRVSIVAVLKSMNK